MYLDKLNKNVSSPFKLQSSRKETTTTTTKNTEMKSSITKKEKPGLILFLYHYSVISVLYGWPSSLEVKLSEN